MKCFTVSCRSKRDGIAVIATEQPYVEVSAGVAEEDIKVPLSPSLRDLLFDKKRRAIFRESYPRIMSCDVDKRSIVWLTEPSAETNSEALFLVYEEVCSKKVEVPSVSMKIVGEGGEIIVRASRNQIQEHSAHSRIAAEAVLVRLPRGAALDVERTVRKPRSLWSSRSLSAMVDETLRYRVSVDRDGRIAVREIL